MLKRFLSYYKPQMGLFVADTICALVLAAIDLAFPIILRNLCGGLFTQGQTAIMQALGMVAVGLVLMYAARCACRYFMCQRRAHVEKPIQKAFHIPGNARIMHRCAYN